MTPVRAEVRWFFFLTFAITWGLQLPGVLAQRGLLPGDPQAYLPLAGLGLFGPLVAATMLSWRQGGRAAVRALYAPLLHVRVHVGWYVMALAVPGLLLTGILALLGWAGRSGPIVYLPTLGGAVLGLFISLVEEIGWRGYAQPRLDAQVGPLGSAIILGIVWYLWHLPMFAGQGIAPDLVLVMLLYFVGASLFLSWLKAGTGGSLLVVVAAHWGAHLDNSHRALPADIVPLIVQAIVYAALGLYFMRRFYLPAARRAADTL
jgi:membrane protease YdiL (CAAX protease family)